MKNKKIKLQLAREFRKKATKSETIMWNALRNRKLLNLKFRRQHIIKGYVIDFYCHELKLAIEIDGIIHRFRSKDDKTRQENIEQSGITFYRIQSGRVERDVENVLIDLTAFINTLTLNPSPTRRLMGEGNYGERATIRNKGSLLP